MTTEENIPLAAFTTFHIGGYARYFAHVQNIEEIRAALAFAKKKELKVLILGGGSNLLISDEGFDGLVIKNEITGIEKEGSTLVAGAGESLDALVAKALEENLWGVENLSGIPGTVGGATAGSIGAYGQSISQTLLWAEVLDASTGEIKKMNNPECRFGYRESIFSPEKSPLVILRVAFQLSVTPKPDVSYKDISLLFAGREPSLKELREAVLRIRKSKFPDLAVEGTAGSFFKNPVLPLAEAQKLRERYPDMPVFALPEAHGVKIPLAWLLDKVLGMRGTQEGGARLYEKQPLVIVAEKNCIAADVRALAELVQKKVMQEFGFSIEPEVKIF